VLNRCARNRLERCPLVHLVDTSKKEIRLKPEEQLNTELPPVVFLSGIVTKLGEPGICMDGATHLIHTVTGSDRLVATTSPLKAELDRVAGTRLRVTVVGIFIFGPECRHFNVHFMAPMNNVVEMLLHGGGGTFPFKGGGDALPWRI